MKKEIQFEEFNKTLPFTFRDAELLKKVFVHRSYLNEKNPSAKALESNERLEFLGDAVLSNAISHLLYDRFPEIDEGGLTKLRARLVNRKTLARLAKDLSLNSFMLLGKGERSNGGSDNPMILSGAFEALIAAIYMERGFLETFSYIENLFAPLIESSVDEPGHFDFKPRLQELAQKVYKEPPAYRLIKEEGPPHKKTFEVEVVIDGEVLGRGTAARKKDAEQLAAGEALKKLTERLCPAAPR